MVVGREVVAVVEAAPAAAAAIVAAADAVEALDAVVVVVVDDADDDASVNELERTGDGPKRAATGEPGAAVIAADDRPMKLPPRAPLDAPLPLLELPLDAALAMTAAALPLLVRAGAPSAAGGAAPPCLSAY